MGFMIKHMSIFLYKFNLLSLYIHINTLDCVCILYVRICMVLCKRNWWEHKCSFFIGFFSIIHLHLNTKIFYLFYFILFNSCFFFSFVISIHLFHILYISSLIPTKGWKLRKIKTLRSNIMYSWCNSFATLTPLDLEVNLNFKSVK